MFKTFPEFTKPTVDDREEYEALIKDYPVVSDVSLTKLLCWWNPLNSLAIATLEGNVVLSYWMPGHEKNSGLSLVGVNNTDVAVCAVMDYLRERGDEPSLVHVPEFVVSSLRYPEQFSFTEERDNDECVIDLTKLFPLSNMAHNIRSKVGLSVARLGGDRVKAKPLDLRSFVNRQQLVEADRHWHHKGSLNDTLIDRHEAVRTALTIAVAMELENICLFIDGELAGFLLYKRTQDKEHVLCYLFNLDYEIPGVLDLMVHHFAKWFIQNGIRYANIDSDMGLPQLRSFRLKLGPVNFVRKYTIKPAEN